MYCVSVSIRSDENLIRRASSKGISYVGLSFVPPLEGRIRSLSDALCSSRVKAESFHGPFGLSCDIGSFDPEQRRSAIRQHKKHVEYCASLGSGLYVIHPGLDNYLTENGGSWDDTRKIATFPRNEKTIAKLWETNVLSLAEIADFAASLSVKVATETGPTNIITPKETLCMVQMADRKNLGICLDTGHVNVGGIVKPSDAIREIGHLVWVLHLHDNNGDGDFHLVPGRGNIDWNDVAKALHDISYGGVLNLELTPTDWDSEQTWSEIEEGVLFLRNLR
jgi:sugar phosphate isomerase/epimerase